MAHLDDLKQKSEGFHFDSLDELLERKYLRLYRNGKCLFLRKDFDYITCQLKELATGNISMHKLYAKTNSQLNTSINQLLA